MNRMESGFTLIGILLVVLIIAAIGYGGFSFNKNNKNNKTIQQNVDRQLEEIQRQNNERNKLNTQALGNIEKVATTTD